MSIRIEAPGVPLTSGQERLWVYQQRFPAGSAYHITGVFNVPAGVQAHDARLEAILNRLCERHDALRTTFGEVNGRPLQLPRSAPPPRLRGVTVDTEQAFECLKREVFTAPFDLGTGPLLRVVSARLRASGEHKLVWVLHHIVGDGVSLSLLAREMLVLMHGEPEPCWPPAASYLACTTQHASAARSQQDRDYWLEVLQDRPARLELPVDYARQECVELGKRAFSVHVDAAGSDALRRFSGEGLTPFMPLLAAFFALMHLCSGQTDVLVGVPMTGRVRKEFREAVGFFANTAALRCRVGPGDSFRDLLARTRSAVLGAVKHQQYPFPLLVDDLDLDTASDAGFPLTPVFFNMLPTTVEEAGFMEHPLGFRELYTDAMVDMDWYVSWVSGQVRIECQFRRALFHDDTVRELVEGYVRLLGELVVQPQLTVSQTCALCAVPAAPRPLSARAAEFRSHSLVSAFERSVSVDETRPAVVGRGGGLSYGAVDRLRNGFASQLAKHGVTRGDRVALLYDQHVLMVPAILAVLTLGAVYVPLDSTQPEARLEAVLADAAVRVLVSPSTAAPLVARLRGAFSQDLKSLCWDGESLPQERATRDAAAETPAYILYTSGSTGTPKGVVQTQGNAVYHARCYIDALEIGPQDRVALLSSFSFDSAAQDMFSALLAGAALHVFDVRQSAPAAVVQQLAASAVSIVHGTPTVFRHLLRGAAHGCLPAVRWFVLGGEPALASDVALFERIAGPDARLINGMGQTESTLALHYRPERGARCFFPLPVGFPVGETEVLLMDADRQLDHVFATGEIVIVSPHVALGYWKRGAETARCFGVNPLGRRYYRTGDLGRRWVDGSIRPLGRRDRQVKVSGVRVELEEVEAIARQVPAVAECVCVASFTESETGVVAFVVWSEGAVRDAARVRQEFRRWLPLAACPSRIIEIEHLPLTASGKVDRQGLLARIRDEPQGKLASPSAGPTNPTEVRVCATVGELLGVHEFGIDDNFFNLGGHSLQAVRLVSRLNEAFALELSVREVFAAPTIRDVAAAVDRQLLLKQVTRTPVGAIERRVVEF